MIGRISGAGEGNQLAVIVGVRMPILLLGNLIILRLLGWFRFTTLLFLGEYFLYGVVVSLANIHTLPLLSPALMVLPIVASILLDARFGLTAIAFVVGVAGLLAFLEGRLPDPVFPDMPPALGLMFGSASGLVFGVVVFNTIVIWGITMTRRLAEERDRLLAFRSEFISAVNHELRTPITAVAGAISLIEAGTVGPLDAQTKKLIGIAKRNSDMLSTLINDILDIERMEEGTYEVSVEDLDLVEVVWDSIALNEVYARWFSVTFDLVGTQRARPSRPTGTACCRFWTICCPTPLSFRPRTVKWRFLSPHAMDYTALPSPIEDPESRKTSKIVFSNASARAVIRKPKIRPAQVLASVSPSRSSNCTAGPLDSNPCRRAARRSTSIFPPWSPVPSYRIDLAPRRHHAIMSVPW